MNARLGAVRGTLTSLLAVMADVVRLSSARTERRTRVCAPITRLGPREGLGSALRLRWWFVCLEPGEHTWCSCERRMRVGEETDMRGRGLDGGDSRDMHLTQHDVSVSREHRSVVQPMEKAVIALLFYNGLLSGDGDVFDMHGNTHKTVGNGAMNDITKMVVHVVRV